MCGPGNKPARRGTLNELWHMDFNPERAAVGPLAVPGDHSHYLLVLQAVSSAHGELVSQPGVRDGSEKSLLDRVERWLPNLGADEKL